MSPAAILAEKFRKIDLPSIINAYAIILPQNLIAASGTLWEDFESTGDWTPEAGTVAANTIQFMNGTQSVKLISYAGATANMTKKVDWDLSGDWQQLRFWMYLHNTSLSDYASPTSIMIKLYTTPFSSWFQAWWPQLCIRHSGWNLFTVPKNYFKVGGGSPRWEYPIERLRFEVRAAPGKVAAVSFDVFEVGYLCVPAVMMRFDDGYSSQYAEAFTYMKTRNICGTLYQRGDWIDKGDRISSTNLREMQVGGQKPWSPSKRINRGGIISWFEKRERRKHSDWTIGNHTRAHSVLSELSEPDQEAAIANGKADLDAFGLPGGKYVAYPEGRWNNDTRIAMYNLGMLTGASVQHTTAQAETPYPPIVLPSSDLFNIGGTPIDASVSLESAKGYIDEAIAAGTIISPIFHSIGENSLDWSLDDFQALIDYIVSKNSQLVSITIDDLYKLTLGPVSVPVITD